MSDAEPATAGPARRHHYVPEFYLRRFVDAEGKVLRTFKAPSGVLHERRYPPKATGFQEDLYSIEPETINHRVRRPDRIEVDFFGPIDNGAAPLVQKVLDFAPSALSHDERRLFAVFVNSLIERHPQRLRKNFELAEASAADHADEFIGRVPAERKEYWTGLLSTVDALARNAVRDAMTRVVLKEDVITYFAGMQWLKIHLEPGGAVEFITGDNPVLINFSQPWPIEMMTLALSPLDLLLMVKSGAEDFTRELYLHMTLLHNLELLRQSEYIFSRGPLQDYEGLRSRHAAGLTLPVRPWDKSPGPRK